MSEITLDQFITEGSTPTATPGAEEKSSAIGFEEFMGQAPQAPTVPAPRESSSVAVNILKGLPEFSMDVLKEAGKATAAAAAYEAAGAVKGATLGYFDPTKFIDDTELAKQGISKPIAGFAGQFAGALAPISILSQAVGVGLTTAGVLNEIHPVLQGLVHAGITGSIYGAVENPNENVSAAKSISKKYADSLAKAGGDESKLNPEFKKKADEAQKVLLEDPGEMARRAHNALDNAAGFIVFTGAGQLFDEAANAMGLGKTSRYNALREDIIDIFVKKGANEEQAAAMADTGLQEAIKNGGGWEKVTASDLGKARNAVKAGEKIVLDTSKVPEPIEPFKENLPAVPAEPVKPAEAKVQAELPVESNGMEIGGGKPPTSGLVVANIGADGKIYYGEPGDLHYNIGEKYPHSQRGDWQNIGFANSKGEFLTREEAFTQARSEGVSVPNRENMPNQLDAKDYQEKTGILYKKKQANVPEDAGATSTEIVPTMDMARR